MRTIPLNLLNHKKQTTTTLCNLIKIKTRDGGVVIGCTNLNTNIKYNDGSGDGDIEYNSYVGFEPANIYYSSTAEVDNTEFKSLVPVFDFDLNEVDINSGRFDYSDFWIYEVNYMDLTQGHWTVLSGKLGEMRTENGIAIHGEVRSQTDQLKKSVCELDSLSCRAKFGSQNGEEAFPCFYNTNTLWSSGTVSSLGIEEDLQFTDTSRVEPSGTFEPGLIQFLTGKNAGLYVEVDKYNGDTKTINLKFPCNYNIQIGDTYRIRVDCNKQARDSNKGCKKHWGSNWIYHFRGEPDIPVGDKGNSL